MTLSRTLVCAIVAGSTLLVWLGRRAETHHTAAVAHHIPEKPWLSHEAADALFGDRGVPGPLFDGAWLGGPSPTPAVRERIAAFARANRVAIDLDVSDDRLAAIRLAVDFGGCCGYEGADVLALRLGRPRTDTCCGCGEHTWANEWAIAHDEGTHMRARVSVNRIDVQWQPQLALTEVLDRAEQLIGTPVTNLTAHRGERLIERTPGSEFTLAMPFAFDPGYSSESIRYGRDLGLHVAIEHGRISEVSFGMHGDNDELTAALRHRWGPPSVSDESRTWRSRTVEITAERDEVRRLVLRAR